MNAYRTALIPLRVDERQLEGVSADALKRMSVLWGGTGGENKTLCMQRIINGLADAAMVKQALTGLNPETRAALAIIREHGGIIDAAFLEDTLEAYGYSVKKVPEYSHGFYTQAADFTSKLFRKGLLMATPGHAQYAMHDAISVHAAVYTDERILRQVDWPLEVLPLSLTPVDTAPSTATFRRPLHVMLDLLAVTRTLDEMKQLQLTKSQSIRVADMRKFQKLIGWAEDQTFDGNPFPQSAYAVLLAWIQLGWLKGNEFALTLALAPDAQAKVPLLQQVSLLAQAFLNLTQWSDMAAVRTYYPETLRLMRVLVFHCLRALPDDGHFYSLEALLPALYDRIGDMVQTLPDYQNPRPRQVGRDNAQYQRLLSVWRQQNRPYWIAHERDLISAILRGWPYWLGLLEIGRLDNADLAFRLTDMGRMLFAQDVAQPPQHLPAPISDHPAWVVQPNYDLIVYLDAITPEQLSFLERHAERRQTETHTIHYQLTRNSVYHGLENGTSIDELLAMLRQGAKSELPQNVERELRDWAGQREQLTIITQARVLAFSTPTERASALAAGLTGKPVGDTYLLQSADEQGNAVLKAIYGAQLLARVDYTQPLPRCLQVEEDGTLTLTKSAPDLLLPGQLAHCAEVVEADRRWRITQASLAPARQAGVTATTLLTTLQPRLINALPALLEVAIRNALGARTAVQAGNALVLRITDKVLYAAITSSAMMKPFLLDVPGPDTLIIDLAHEEAFKDKLRWLGVKLTGYTASDKILDWQQILRDAKTQQRQRRRGY